jgi:hypothetical protein
VVREQDLPMNQIYQFDEKDLSKLCIRDLSAGEENGRLGYRPPRSNTSALSQSGDIGTPGLWFGPDPTDAPLMLRDESTTDIDALTITQTCFQTAKLREVFLCKQLHCSV